MKKVLIICEAIGGGVRKHIIDLLLNSDNSKFSKYILYSETGADHIFKENINELEKNGVKLYSINHFVNHISLKDDFKALIKIIKVLKKEKPDIVHCHSSKAGALGRIAAKYCRIEKIIYTPHAYAFQSDTLGKIKKKLYILIEKLLGKITDLTVNVSEGERQSALDYKILNKSKSVVVYNGIHNYNIAAISAKKKDKIIIGTTMRMEVQKDPLTFVEIAKSVILKYPNVEFIFVGDGSLKQELEESIVKNNLEGHVKLLGFRKNIIDIVETFDIYLITSLYEGLPYSILEALGLGKPIVATNVTGNNEIVIEDYNGLLFEPRNAVQGAEKIELLLNNSTLRNFYGRNSRKLYEDHFTIEKMLESLDQIYENTIPTLKRIDPVEKRIQVNSF